MADLLLLPEWDPPVQDPNPMIRIFGPGPEGTRCKTCVHLVQHSMGRTWYKCRLRRNTSSPATDHRVRWNACGKYEGGS